ncbi:MAG: hypothetical protein KAS39_04310, partial [Actinomycetia bacterium]|nr:hypothetical protein [Actinomycetes bacterium]
QNIEKEKTPEPKEEIDVSQLLMRLSPIETFDGLHVTTVEKRTEVLSEGQVEVTETINIDYSFEPQAGNPDGIFRLKTTYSSLKFKGEWGPEIYEYDSANPRTKIYTLLRGYDLVAEESFIMEIFPNGRVGNISEIEEMQNNMMGKTSISEGFSNYNQLKKLIEFQFNKNSIRDSMQSIIPFYPEGRVETGSSWTTRVVIYQDYPMISNESYTLKERKNGVVIIIMEATITPNTDIELDTGVAKLKYKVSGEKHGTFEIDEITGWIIRGKVEQIFSGDRLAEMYIENRQSNEQAITVEKKIIFESIIKEEDNNE